MAYITISFRASHSVSVSDDQKFCTIIYVAFSREGISFVPGTAIISGFIVLIWSFTHEAIALNRNGILGSLPITDFASHSVNAVSAPT
jgi:hypothetical protein